MTDLIASRLADIAHRHLPEAEALRWLALLRPCVRLVPARPGDPVVGRLAGTPSLPEDFVWPVWPDRGSLFAGAEVDLAALAASGLDTGLVLPRQGRLIAFFLDDPCGYGAPSLSEPASLDGARLLHVPHGADDLPWAPPDSPSFAGIELTAVQEPSWSDLTAELADITRGPASAGFFQELWEFSNDAELSALLHRHVQVGGWSQSIQSHVEEEVARASLGEDLGGVAAETGHWRTLLEVGPIGDMPLSDGVCFWLCRDGEKSLVSADEARFAYQCT